MLSLLQNVVEPEGVMVATGEVFTTTVTGLDDAVHPAALVTTQ
jgi:hypothetical protein